MPDALPGNGSANCDPHDRECRAPVSTLTDGAVTDIEGESLGLASFTIPRISRLDCARSPRQLLGSACGLSSDIPYRRPASYRLPPTTPLPVRMQNAPAGGRVGEPRVAPCIAAYRWRAVGESVSRYDVMGATDAPSMP